MFRILLFIFSLFVLKIFASNSITSPIYHSVNVITGEYNETETEKSLINEYYTDGEHAGKVKARYAPSGVNAPIQMCRFVYHSRFTEVFDANNVKTIYRFNENNLLTHIQQYDGDRLYRTEKFFRDPIGRITSRCLLDENNSPFVCHTFDYDVKGNIIKKTLHGNLSGNASGMQLMSTGYPTIETESYSTTYTYSNEQLMCEREDNGTSIKYEYDQKSGALILKEVCENDFVRIRHEFFYDDKNNLIKKSIKHDLNGTPESFTIKYSYHPNSPNTPEIIEEFVNDKLVKMTHNQFSTTGKVVQQEIVNSEDIKKNQRSTFDEMGRPLLIESNGISVEYEYDTRGNVVRQKDNHLETKFVYDYNDRCIQKEEIHVDGVASTSFSTYNTTGKELSSTDGFGNITQFKYDAFGRLVETNLNSKKQIRKYDICNRIIEKIDENGSITIYHNTARGDPFDIIYSNGTSEHCEYNPDGSLRKAVASNGTCTQYNYDFLARVKKKERLNSGNAFEIDCNASIWSDLYNGISSFFNTITNFLQSLSYYNCNKKEVDGVANDLFGERFLELTGYYSDPGDVGVSGKGELSPKVRVTATNGIMNLKKYALDMMQSISSTHGDVNVHYVFYPSGGWTWDIVKAFFVKSGYVCSEAYQIAQVWKEMIAELGGPDSGGLIIHYAHSLGGTNTELAKQFLTEEELRMIRVITFGSPTMVANEDFESATNYVSMRDVVTYVGLIGSSENDNVIYLGSLLGIPFVDHYIMSETYQRMIKLLGQEFLDSIKTK